MTIDGDVTVVTPRRSVPTTFLTRNDTNDAALVLGIIASDEYDLGRLRSLHGVAVDIGAHIGTIAVALAMDHPTLKVIAVEVVPENVEVLRANIVHNGLQDRVTVIEAAATAPGVKTVSVLWNYRSAKNADQAYVDDSRFIANIFDSVASVSDEHKVRGIDLAKILKVSGEDRIALLKIDCEGCEWQFLRSPAIDKVDLIIGEFHNGGGLESLRALIGKTHEVTQTGGQDDIGTFWATRR